MSLGRSRITARDLGWAGTLGDTRLTELRSAKHYANDCSDSEQVCVLLRIRNFRAVFGGPGTLPIVYVTCMTYSFTLARILYVIKTSYPESGLHV